MKKVVEVLKYFYVHSSEIVCHLLDFLYMAVILMSGIELLMEGKVDAIHAVLTVLGGMKIYHEK